MKKDATITVRITCQAAARLPLDKLEPMQGELKELPAENLAKLRASILKHGVTFPFFVWRSKGHNFIIDAHQRDKALRTMAAEGWTIPPVPVAWIEARNQREAREKILLCNSQYGRMSAESVGIFINKAALEAGELAAITALPFDLGKLIPGASEQDDEAPVVDAATPLQAKWRTRPGQIWELGAHRLACIDCTDPVGVKALMQGQQASMVFTDPPYGVDYQAPGKHGAIRNDHLKSDNLAGFLIKGLKLMVRHATPTAAFYIWHATRTRDDFAFALKSAGLIEKQYIIWVKPTFTLGRDDYQWVHEPCFYCSRDGQSPAFYGKRDQQTVWRFAIAVGWDRSTAIGNGLTLSDGAGHQICVSARGPAGKKMRNLRLPTGHACQLATPANWPRLTDPRPSGKYAGTRQHHCTRHKSRWPWRQRPSRIHRDPGKSCWTSSPVPAARSWPVNQPDASVTARTLNPNTWLPLSSDGSR